MDETANLWEKKLIARCRSSKALEKIRSMTIQAPRVIQHILSIYILCHCIYYEYTYSISSTWRVPTKPHASRRRPLRAKLVNPRL
jgi:hypothetical protein